MKTTGSRTGTQKTARLTSWFERAVQLSSMPTAKTPAKAPKRRDEIDHWYRATAAALLTVVALCAGPVRAAEELDVRISPTNLWPPNHRYVPVEISVDAPPGSELLAVVELLRAFGL